ncbi:hypothetical protein BC832DRAFT_593067 [Gaertneriomyces semiglobifer]|nr:hypothetical protein BC832DRAFT_593067 [Gaertneriomyces semiglobifer]
MKASKRSRDDISTMSSESSSDYSTDDERTSKDKDRKDRRGKRSSKKDKKSKRKNSAASSDDDDIRVSVITGKKIKLKVHKTVDDKVREKNRNQLLQHLNQMYD